MGGKPAEFAPNQNIKGWQYVLPLMVEGDKWEAYIPAELSLGPGTDRPIFGGEILIVRLELLKINGKKVEKERVCEPIRRDDCSKVENEVLDQWSAKSLTDIDSEITATKKKAKYETSRKKKEELQTKLRVLKIVAASKEARKEKEL